MRIVAGSVVLAATLCALCWAGPGRRWEDAPKGSVRGTLKASAPRPKQPVVVYLERQGDELPFTPPPKLEICQKDARFEPGFEVVVVGQKVDFINNEDKAIDHNVYTLGAEEKDLGIFQRTECASHAFGKSGEVLLHCSIHRLMDGRLFVAPNPAYAKVGPEETAFRIEGVPEGSYILRTYQRAKRFHDAEIPLEVSKGKETVVEVELKR